jgi:uncharacterized protein YcbK (DUF882 family)
LTPVNRWVIVAEMRLSAIARLLALIFLWGGGAQAAIAKRKAASRPIPTKGKSKSKSGKSRALAPLALTSTLTRPPQDEAVDAEARASRQTKTKGLKASKQNGKGAKPAVDPWPPLRLEAVNTGEKLTVRLYDRNGRTQRSAIRKIWHLMRCHLTGREKPINWRLIRNMYKVARHYPGRTIYVYSGYRARKVASLRSSNHIKGRAVDFNVSGVANRALRDYLMNNFRPCGVGYYPNGPFVHFDVREKQSAFWVDYAGKGESAEYASDPYAVLKSEKEQAKPKKAEDKPIAPKAKPAEKAPAAAEPAAGADEPSSSDKPAESGAATAAGADEPPPAAAPAEE